MVPHWLRFAGSLTFAVLFTDASAGAQSTQFKDQILKVASFGGGTGKIFHQAVTPPFESRTGAHIEWSEGAPPDFFAQLAGAKGGDPPYDVVFLDGIEEQPAAALGVIYKLNLDNIPNAALLDPNGKTADGRCLAWGYTRYGIAYLPDKLKAADIAPPKDLSMIFDPRLEGHVALPDVTQPNWPNFMPTFAAYFGNPLRDPKSTIDKLASIKGVSLFASSSDMEARMTSGEIWVSLWIDGRVNQLKLKGLNIDLGPMGIPDGKGGLADYTAVTSILCVANPKRQALAETFIDTMLSTPVATEIAIKSTYASSNVEAQKALVADPKVGPLLNVDTKKLFFPDLDNWPQYQNKWIDAWGRAFNR